MDKSLHERLADIQANLVAKKGQFNKFGGYHYRSCEDILAAVKPLLNGLVLTLNDDIFVASPDFHVEKAETKDRFGKLESVYTVFDRVYIKSTATITDGKDSISTTAFAREAMIKKGQDSSQISGGTGSYSRKYALNGLLAIDDSKDADATNDHGKAPVKAQQKPPAKAAPKTEHDLAMEVQAPLQKPSLKACTEMLGACGDLTELKSVWTEIYSHYQGSRYIEGLSAAKDEMKERF